MNAHELAAERRLEAALAELHGDGVPRDLALRVRRRLVRPTPRPLVHAAAFLLLGSAVVLGVALLHSQHGDAPAAVPAATVGGQEPAPPQQPAPRPLPETRVFDARPTVDLEQGQDARAAFDRVAGGHGFSLVAADDVAGTNRKPLRNVPWRVALGQLAADLGAEVTERAGILVLRRGDPGLRYELPFVLPHEVEVRDFAKQLAARCGVGLVLADGVRGRVGKLDAASWRDALDAVAAQLGLQVDACGRVFVLRPSTPDAAPPPRTPPPPGIQFATDWIGKARSAGEAFDDIAHGAGLNLVVDASVRGTVSFRGHDCSAEALTSATAAALGARLYAHGHLLRVEPRPEPVWTDLVGQGVDLRTLAELLHASAQVEVAVPDGARERVTVFANHVPVDEIVAAVALATGRHVAPPTKAVPFALR